MTHKHFTSFFHKNFKFIILGIIFISLRLYQINQPLIEMHHVRQTQTAMIAKNLLEDRFNLFYTRIDWHGNDVSYYVQEFPLYQSIVALFWKILGKREIIGRCVSLFFSILATVFLYKISKELFSRNVAYWTAVFFAISPISIFLSRAFMINMTSLSLYLVGFYYWLLWFDRNHPYLIIPPIITFTLATLNNITTGLPFFIPILYLTIKYWKNSRKFYFSLILFWSIFTTTILAWNLHAARVNNLYYPAQSAENLLVHFFFQPGYSRFNLYLWFRIFMYLLFFAAGFHGFTTLSLGIKSLWKGGSKSSCILLSWVSGAILYYLVYFTALSGHNYYILPVIPILSICIGLSINYLLIKYRMSNLKFNIKVLILIFIMTIPIWIIIALLHMTHEDRVSYDAALSAKRYSSEKDLVLVATLHTLNAPPEMYPTTLYYANRRGWNIGNASKPNIDCSTIERFRQHGAKFLIVTFGKYEHNKITNRFPLYRKFFSRESGIDAKDQLIKLKKKYTVIEESKNYILFRL